jgi:DNA polymerase III delta subunit
LATDIANRSLTDNIIKLWSDDLDKYVSESQLTPLVGHRVFILYGMKTVPELPVGDQDILILVGKALKDDRAVTHEVKALKTYDDNNEVIKWILQEGERLNIDLKRVAGALFVNNGKRLRKIASEINKLSILTPKGELVTPEIAKSVLCFSVELTPKQIVDAICSGNPILALIYYDKMQENADEVGWIIAYLQRQFLQLIRIHQLRSRGTNASEIASEVGIHSFVFKKLLNDQFGLWSVESLRLSLCVLCDLDIKHKQGNRAANLGLELEIVRLAEEAHAKRISNN